MKQLILLLFLTINLNAQERVSLAVYIDPTLMIKGDTHNNPAGTLNYILQLKMQGNEQKYGYLVVFPEFEYADLSKSYIRYSANIGYTFYTPIKHLEALLSGGWGILSREGTTWHSGSLEGVISLKINKFKINLMSQLVDRRDIKEIRFSGFVGIELYLN